MIAVLLVYDQAPLSLISLKKAGIEKPADLMGRKGGAPTVDATYRLFNVFARVNGIDPARVQWANVQPQIREPMLVRGEIDFAAAWVMTAVPSLLGLGVKRDDINVIMLRDYGVDLYANVVFTTPAFARQHPDAVRGFVKATIQSWQNAAADPDAAIAALKKAEALSDPAVEIVRLKWALDFVVTPSRAAIRHRQRRPRAPGQAHRHRHRGISTRPQAAAGGGVRSAASAAGCRASDQGTVIPLPAATRSHAGGHGRQSVRHGQNMPTWSRSARPRTT